MKKFICALISVSLLLSSLSVGYAEEPRKLTEKPYFNVHPAYSSNQWTTKRDNSFDYPVQPGSSEWSNFSTHDEMLEACTIPDEILHNISTKDLVRLVLNYPLLNDYNAFSSEQQGLEILISNFNGLQELIARDDGILELVKEYQRIPVNNEILPSSLKNISDDNFASELKKLERENSVAYDTMIANYEDYSKASFIEALIKHFKSKLTSRETEACEKANLLEYHTSSEPISDNMAKANIVLKTPSGKVVPSSQYIYDRPELSASEIASLRVYVTNTFPKATILRSATRKYNCHSYAWYSQSTSNKIWLNTCITYRTDSKSYKRKIGLINVNDKVVYGADVHSGIVYKTNGDSTGALCTVRSKWGQMPLMEHKALYVPSSYSANLTFYGRV